MKFNQISYQDLTEMIDVGKFTAENICVTDPDVIVVFGSRMAAASAARPSATSSSSHTGIPCITTFCPLVKVLTASVPQSGVGPPSATSL